MYYAKVLEILPSLSGNLHVLIDVIYGFNSYKWRDTFIREFNELAQMEPYSSNSISSRASVVRRDVFKYEQYIDITGEHPEYMPLNAVKVWIKTIGRDSAADLGQPWRVSPTVRVPSKVNYLYRGGYAVPDFLRGQNA